MGDDLMPDGGRDERTFGAMAARLKLVSETQLAETLEIQRKMREMGVDEPLGEILVKKGYLSDEQRRKVLGALGVYTSPIPGYRLLGKIARGGMGTVYRAVQESMNRVVAVKVLSSLYTRDPSFVARFLREARSAAALDHKNIIHAIDVGQCGDTFYFVMEFVEGRTVGHLMAEAKCLDQERTLEIALQVAEALDYIHQHRMVHRDVKPDNLMRTADGTIKLCDFGLARGVDSDQSVTLDGLTVGTPYYISPEQAAGQADVDIRADLYSLGATMYFLATGHWVFAGKTSAETLLKHQTEPPLDPRQRNARLTEDFALIVLRLLEKDRKDRYQTPRELMEDLRKLQGGAAPTRARQYAAARSAVRKPTARHVPSARPAGAPAWARAAGVALAAMVAIALVLALTLRTSPSGRPAEPGTPSVSPVAAAPSETPRPVPHEDASQVAAAAELFRLAEEEFKGGRWAETQSRLERLQRDFSALPYVVERSARIGEMLGECKSAQLKTARETERRFQKARGLIEQGEPEEGRLALEALRPAGEVTAEAIQKALAECAFEIEADRAMELLVAYFKEQRWSDALTQVDLVRRRYVGAWVLKPLAPGLVKFEADARRELDAGECLLKLRKAASRAEWTEAVPLLEEIERLSSTKTYGAHRDEIARLRQAAAAGARNEMERLAREAWEETQRTFDGNIAAGRHEEARAAVEAFRELYQSTGELARRADALKAMLKKCDELRARQLEEQAAEALRKAREAAGKRRWGEAMKQLGLLAADYADTRAARDPAVRRIREECEREGGFGPHVLLRFDFEDPKSGWAFDFDTDVKPDFDVSTDAREGVKAGLFTFPAARRGSFSMIYLAVDALAPTAHQVVFWARSRRTAAGQAGALRLMLVEDDEDFEEFSTDVVLASEWKRHVVELTKLEFVWSRRPGNLRLDREKVKRIAFFHERRTVPLEFLVDLVTVEKK